MRVIGTAGHVDHGKSALVEALTGTHPDRLKEEQAREMTIDLGFAWMTLDNGEAVGIVDVPGHRDFIENMLAGVGGIDAALFVIAADEGVMPQTREHLAILDILQIPGGIVVLNKIDLINDPEWIDLVEEDIRRVLHGTVLEEAPIVRVSAKTGQGIAEMKEELAACLGQRPQRPDFKKPRLNIDRVFSIAGFGSVVTGTLLDGNLKVGDEIEVLPQGLKGRVRGLQSHKKKEDTAVAGSRTAVNISGIDLQDFRRGNVISHPGDFHPSQRIDVSFDLLKDSTLPLKHSDEVKFFVGSAEVVARVRLLGKEEIIPGDSGWLQLELREPVIAVKGDRYILRRPSPGETLGGGAIIDPHPGRRHKRFSNEAIEHLKLLEKGTPAEVFLRTCIQLGAAPLKEIAGNSHLSEELIPQVVNELIETGQLIQFNEGISNPTGNPIIIPAVLWQQETKKAREILEKFHKAFPLRKGIPREEFKSRLRMVPRIYNLALTKWLNDRIILESENLISLPDHRIEFSRDQKVMIENLEKKFSQSPFSPPSVKESQTDLGGDVYQAIIEQGQFIQVSSEVVFRKQEFEIMLNFIKQHIKKSGTITAAEFRDHFQTSRKYALAFLEYLDARGITQRDGDVRKLKEI